MTFTPQQLTDIRQNYARISASAAAKRFVKACTVEQLEQLKAEHISFVSALASAELYRRTPRVVHTCHEVSNVRRFCPACGR